MTVKELIDMLQCYEPGVSVVVAGLEYFNEVTAVERATANRIDVGEFDVVDRGSQAVVLIT